MSEFSGDAGTIYIEKSKDADDRKYEVWYEDFCILGIGNSEIEALRDAKRHAEHITQLVSSAIVEILSPEVANAETRIDTVSTTAGTGEIDR